MSTKARKKVIFLPLFNPPHVSVVYTFETFNVYVFYTSTDIFLVLFYNGKNLKVVKITKKIDVQFTQACILQVCYHAEQERTGGDDKKKSEQPFFCHPSWILLGFLRWLCAYMAVHYISGGDGDEKAS